MRTRRRISHDNRRFFSRVTEAIFTNPFSDRRVEIDLEITRLSPKTPDQERIDRLTRMVHEKISQLDNDGFLRLNHMQSDDRELMKKVFLFDFFHQFIEKFDNFILEQIRAGESPLKVSFADQAMSYITRRGFSEAETARYFALCYQIRRAFYFIDTHLVGRSPCMKKLRKNLWNNVFTHDISLYDTYLWDRMEDFSTLILGETGTGKGTSAAAIGRSGFIPFDPERRSFVESFMHSFVSLNLSQFPDTLIESELFGHKKGAFTGAVDDHKGVFDRCSPYGSIFLDEIGEVTQPIQIKLLKVLQERSFSPVGSHKENRFQGRVIAATNRPVNKLRTSGGLRDDFYYRLCSDIIVVPPLRHRIREDPRELDDLLAHTCRRILGKTSGELVKMVGAVIRRQLTKDYPWPGNVRELEQIVRRILIKQTCEGDYPGAPDSLTDRLIHGIRHGSMDVSQLISGYCYLLYQRHKTYEAVASATALDRRTVKKYIQQWSKNKEKNGD